MPKVIKPSNPFTNVCWVSMNTFSALPQILTSTVFSCPPSRNKKAYGDGFFGATAAGLFEQ